MRIESTPPSSHEIIEENILYESLEYLINIVAQCPFDSTVQYQCGAMHDRLGLEQTAIVYYEKAVALGLPKHLQEHAVIGLGSSFRCTGSYEQARKVLEEGAVMFPHNAAIRAFLAMTYYNLGEYQAAMELLLKGLVSAPHDKMIQKYAKAICFHAEQLDVTF